MPVTALKGGIMRKFLFLAAAMSLALFGCDNGSNTDVQPALTGAVSIGGTAKVGQQLTANTTALGGSGDISYQWYRGSSEAIAGATGSTYTLQGTDAGSYIWVEARRAGHSGTVKSGPSAVVAPADPLLTGTVGITGDAKVGETLTAVTTNLDGSGEISYQWLRNEIEIANARSATYLLTDNDRSNNISVRVTRSDRSGSVRSNSVNIAGPSDPPLSGTVSITGAAQAGQTLTAVTTALDGSGALSYRWYRGGAEIFGATGATYLLQQADVSHAITVVVSRAGYSGSVTGGPTGVVIAGAPPDGWQTGTSPAQAVARFGQYMSEETFEELFSRRMGSDFWAEDPENADKPRVDYFSYANLLKAIEEMANLVVITESSNNPEGYGHWNSRQVLLNKATGARDVISKGENWDEPWNLAPGHRETARLDFGSFLAAPAENDRLRELAAFLANVTQETAHGDGNERRLGGLYYNEELAHAGSTGQNYWAYAYGAPPGTPHPLGPAQTGHSYHGRGPIQLSWNYNYGQASAVIYGEMMTLLTDPNRILQDGVLGWKTAIWFWMTPQSPRPSCHQVITGGWTGSWTPSAQDLATGQTKVGFGHTIMVINGGLEGDSSETDGRILGRTSSYRRIAERLGANIAGEKVDTLGMNGDTWFQ